MDESLADTKPLRRLGDFQIVRELGRGGMGIVYEARQVSLNRKVALKVLSASLGLTTKAVLRFQREAEAAAKLHHTNIVPIYATGEQDGSHYYAMELIEGPGLDEVISQMRNMQKPGVHAKGPEVVSASAATASGTPTAVDWISRTMGFPSPDATAGTTSETHGLSSSSLASGTGYFDTVARMVAEVADALDYAHAQGVIHRDIKPSNLLLSPVGRLSLNDFGLARILEQPGMTVSGEFVGSPMYMSPEQIAVGRAPLDHRTDIYSLGATVYEMLTLHPPFPGVRRDQVIAQIIGKEPKPPRSINRRIPQDLETICLKMMEKDPDKRYQTAGSVAEDLRRYVNRFAISARRIGPVGRVVRWAKRNRATAAALCFVVLLGLLAGVFAYRERVARQRILEEKRQHAIEDAVLAASSGDFDEAERSIKEAELVGASTGWVRLLRGQIAYYRGDYREAVQHLEQSVKLLPESVAAHALLARAYSSNDQYDRYTQLQETLEKMPAVTPEDYLFKGLAESEWDPLRALKTLDEAIRRRNSVLARCVRCVIYRTAASDRGDPNAAELGIADARVAKAMMPGGRLGLLQSFSAHLVAAGVYEQTGPPENYRAMVKAAGGDLDALERSPAKESAATARFQYELYLQNNLPGALEAARRACNGPRPSSLSLAVYATCLWGRGECEAALKVLSEPPAPQTGFLADQVRFLALLEVPGGQAKVEQLIMTGGEADWDETRRLMDVICLLGRRAEAIARLRRARDRYKMNPLIKHRIVAKVDYICDVISEQDYVKALRQSRFAQCDGYWTIALRRLADGDRAGAAEYFRESLKTNYYPAFAWLQSRMALARMEQDPNWPPWIPLKEPAPQPTNGP